MRRPLGPPQGGKCPARLYHAGVFTKKKDRYDGGSSGGLFFRPAIRQPGLCGSPNVDNTPLKIVVLGEKVETNRISV
jgi:hypothetical protein